MFDTIRKNLQKDDVGVSAVIGTILMIAVTVILGGVIYAAIGGFGSKDIGASKIDAVFKATAVDTDQDGVNDLLKITYLSGPSATVGVNILRVDADTPAGTTLSCGPLAAPGDTCVLKSTTAGVTTTVTTGTYQLTVSVNSQTMLDSTVKIA